MFPVVVICSFVVLSMFGGMREAWFLYSPARHLGSFPVWILLNTAATNYCVSLHMNMFSFLICKYLEVQLKGHTVKGIFNFLKKLFSKVPVPFYSPTSNVSEFFYILTNTSVLVHL